ncbi:MAG: nickel pincer cofactor biosynthesis protein LarC [Clostridia bacterium]|nr:nickel pincer cofactor biosynthesis protein LarC [Clostridia bacterium]
MRILYLDCSMGAAGDMLTAALYELLGENEKKAFIQKMNALGLPGVTVEAEPSVKCGITGTHISVKCGGLEEDEHGHHEHHHDHEHHHHHHSDMHGLSHIINDLPVSDKVKNSVISVYETIAGAESAIHGVPIEEIHFHEVGALDAVADVTSVCLLMDMLAPDKVVSSPVHVGSGQVECAHGILPVPAPATAHILRGVPIYGGNVSGELCTPTGAALLKYFADLFGQTPVMIPEKIGYGMGKKDFEAANCVRAILGNTDDRDNDTVAELACNIDDMTAEDIAYASGKLLEDGALDVYTVPIGMKKSRPGTMLCVLCRGEDKADIVRLIFKHTTTIGIRENVCRRYTLSRLTDTVDTRLGKISVKYSEGYGVRRAKPEFDDISKIADENGSSLEEVRKIIQNLQE